MTDRLFRVTRGSTRTNPAKAHNNLSTASSNTCVDGFEFARSKIKYRGLILIKEKQPLRCSRMMDSLKFVCCLVFVAFSSGLAESLQRRSLDSVRNSTDCSGCEAPDITAALVNQTELVGKKSVLKCFAKGQPTPNITWYKNDIEIDAANKGTIVIKSIDRGSRLKIKPLQKSDSGRYYCKAANEAGVAVSNVAFLVVKDISWNKTIFPITTKRFNDGVFTYPAPTAHPGYCVSYTGQKCSAYINRRKSIYIKAVNQQTSIEKKLQIAFDSISKSKKISDKCKPYVLPLLCHYLFPYCDDMSSDPKARTLCHEECKLLRDDICMEEYIVAKRESLEHVLFPDCGLLPTKDSEAGKNCIHLPLMFTRTVRYREKKGDRCFNGTGQYYRGNVSITEKGFSCQRWNSTEPNFHLMSPAVHHELRGGHNFCRNPGGKKDRPWCFTTDAKKGYDYCAILRCEEEPPTIHVVSILYTVIPCLVIAIIFSSVVIFICWRCHKQIIYQANQSSTPLMPVTVKTDSKIQEMKDSLRILKDVGEGEFGKFYHCEISTRPESGSVIINQVFVSSLRKSHDEVLRQEFLEDKETWAKLTHPNILPIVGICNQGSPAYVLYEYLECGTLHEYLLRHAPIEDSLEESEDDSMTLWVYDLLSIAYQIAAGMNYLSSNDYVHGDLATRNCMIGARFDVKITDFASSRVGYHHDYYRLPNRRPLPVRWMAPESINSYRFTIESDIWSFGVVLWELFSYGAQPYYGLTNEQVIHSFRDYVMLLCPIDCPPSVYVLMTECWDILPPSRPTFSSIYKKLCALRCESSAPLPT